MLDKISSNSGQSNDSLRFQADFENFRVSSTFINDSNLLQSDKSLLGFSVRTNTSETSVNDVNESLLDNYLNDPNLIDGAQYNENAIKELLDNSVNSSTSILKLSFISYFNSKFFLRKSTEINNTLSLINNTINKCDSKEIPSEHIVKVRPINFKNVAYNDLVTLVFRQQQV